MIGDSNSVSHELKRLTLDISLKDSGCQSKNKRYSGQKDF